MRPKPFKLLLSALSLSVMTSCGSGPKVTVCVVVVASNGFQCVDHESKTFFLPFAQSDNYVALPAQDMRTLIEYCGLKSDQALAVSKRADEIQYLANEAKRKAHGDSDSYGD